MGSGVSWRRSGQSHGHGCHQSWSVSGAVSAEVRMQLLRLGQQSARGVWIQDRNHSIGLSKILQFQTPLCYVLQNLPVGLVCLSGLLNAESYRMVLDTGTLAGSKIILGPSNPAPPVSPDPGLVMMDLRPAAAPGSQSPPVETPLTISGTDWECSTMCTMLKMVDLCTT